MKVKLGEQGPSRRLCRVESWGDPVRLPLSFSNFIVFYYPIIALKQKWKYLQKTILEPLKGSNFLVRKSQAVRREIRCWMRPIY